MIAPWRWVGRSNESRSSTVISVNRAINRVVETGFMVSEVALGKAGLVMGLEVSRLARNSADWQPKVENLPRCPEVSAALFRRDRNQENTRSIQERGAV